jgi:hypothetical protein
MGARHTQLKVRIYKGIALQSDEEEMDDPRRSHHRRDRHMSGRGREATDLLTRALLDMAARGERANCSDPITHDLWLSDSDSERAVAVQLCRHCPVETVCRDSRTPR